MINPYMVGPNYASLSNVELIVDATGLTVGATNDYGTVDGSGNVTNLKSLTPGPTGRDFPSNGTAPTLSNGAIVFGGSGRLRHATASTWNFMHFNATAANLKWTVHAVVKFGTSSNPDAPYGLIGNNGSSGANKGISIVFDDRSSVSLSNAFRGIISQGGGNFTFNNTQQDVITPNEFCVVTVETELSTASNFYKQRVWINNRFQSIDVVYTTTALVTTPTFGLEIGGAGNGVFSLVGSIKEIVIQSGIESGLTRTAFINGLIVKHQIGVTAFLAPPDTTQTLDIYNTYQGAVGDYYLSCSLDQHPNFPYQGVRVFTDGVDHAYDIGKEISVQKFTQYGLSYSAKSAMYTPAGSLSVQDYGGGYANSGRHFSFFDVHTVNGAAFEPPHYAIMVYTDDDYDTKTTVDITSLMPSDGLDAWRMYGNLIENGGYLMFPFNKFDSETTSGLDLDPSAVYLLRISNDANPSTLGNWSVITIYPPTAGAYISEPTIIALDLSTLLCLCRNETTKEYTQFISTDNGVNWTNQGDCSFGETFSTAGPCRLTGFTLVTTPVIACWYADRSVPSLKVIYAKASDLISSGVSGWNTGTKTTVINSGRRPHYGDFMHPNGNFDALMLSAYEKNPLDLSNNDLITAVLPSTHYSTVKTALGL